MKAQRWITIGSVRPNWYAFFLNWGCPNCLLMLWHGRVNIFQPREFINWHDLYNSVGRRLEIAGLNLLSMACALPRQPYQFDLRVLVERRPEGKL